MSCSRIHSLALGALVIAAQACAASGASAQSAIADPVAAVRAIYAGTNVNPIYEAGTRRLRRMMMARNVCTVPFSQRVIECKDTLGLLGGANDVRSAIDGDKAGTKVVTVIRAHAIPSELRFVFTRAGTGWQIDEIAAPGVADWPLAPLTIELPAAPAAKPNPAAVDGPASVASTPVRRADRERRLTRQN